MRLQGNTAASTNHKEKQGRRSTSPAKPLGKESQSNPCSLFNDSHACSNNGKKCDQQPDPPQVLDELDLMICHEEFAQLVALANKVRQAQTIQQSSASALTYYQQQRKSIADSNLAPAEVISAVQRMQEKLSVGHLKITRGTYPLTDAMMDDNFSILQQELDLCESCIVKAAQKANSKYPESPGNNKNGSIQSKHSKFQTDTLMYWMIENKDRTCPSPNDLEILSKKTGLTPNQIKKWARDMRQRHLKVTCCGEKPSRFIDFLFLAQNREGMKHPSQESHGKLVTKKSLCRGTPQSPPGGPLPPTPTANAVTSTFQSPVVPCYHIGGIHPRAESSEASILPFTPPLQCIDFSQEVDLNSTPLMCPSLQQIVVSPDCRRKRKREVSEDSEEVGDLSSNNREDVLDPEKESFKEDKIINQDLLEPISIHDVDSGEDILCYFAEQWQASPCATKKREIPLEVALSISEKKVDNPSSPVPDPTQSNICCQVSHATNP